MKKIALGLVALLLVVAAGCRKGNNEGALDTIPSNTAYFCVVNVSKINDNLGNETRSDGDVKLSRDFSQILDRFGKDGDEMRKMLTDNKASLDFKMPLTIFEYKGSLITTFFVRDEEDFRDFLKQNDHTMKEKSGVWEADSRYFMADNQVWISEGASTFTSQTVTYLTNLDEKESLAGEEYAVSLVGGDADMSGWIDIAKLTSMQYAPNMGANVMLNTIFDGAKYLPFTLKFEDGSATAEMKVLNAKFEPAPYLIKSSGIDASLLESYKGRGSLFFAFSMEPKQIKQLLDQYGNLAGAAMKPFLDLLADIDGTIIGSATMSSISPSFGIMAGFTSDETASQASRQLSQMFSGEAAVEQTGKNIYIHVNADGGDDISKYIDDLKGALWGMAYGGSEISEQTGGMIRKCVVKAVPEGESCVITMKLDTKSGQNALQSIMEAASLKSR